MNINDLPISEPVGVYVDPEIKKLMDEDLMKSAGKDFYDTIMLPQDKSFFRDNASNNPANNPDPENIFIDSIIPILGLEAAQIYCRCNIIKYTSNRNNLEDMNKAQWYMDKYVEISQTKEV